MHLQGRDQRRRISSAAAERPKPPVDLNRTTMDKYRPLMEKHYLVEKPVFS